MASGQVQGPVPSSSPAQKFTSIHESNEDSQSSPPRPAPYSQRRPSSIRFSQDTSAPSLSPMSTRRRRTSSADEALPIRHADGNFARNYNTNTDGSSHEDDVPFATDAASTTPADSGQPNSQEPEEKTKWYKTLAEKYGSISLENKGSVARDHLALERTFLAWMRTSLAFASIGIAITQLFRLNTSIANRSQQYEPSLVHQLIPDDGNTLPLSPLVDHPLQFEVAQALQDKAQPLAPQITYGSTLLDQLLNPPALSGPPVRTESREYSTAGFDEDAATKLRHVGKPLGATFLGVSIIVLFVGFHRYFEAQHWIIKGKFPASRGSVALVGFIAGALIVASLVVVLVIAPTSFEKK